MVRVLAVLHQFARHALVTTTSILALTFAGFAYAADNAQASDEMRADCRAEGEAGGLEGTELEAFVRDCVADLLTVEITNIDRK